MNINEYLELHHIVKKKGYLIGYTFKNLNTGHFEYHSLENLPNYIENVKRGRINSRGYLTIDGVLLGNRKVDTLEQVRNYCIMIDEG